MTMQIDLSTITLLKGSHDSPEHGMCAMEAVAWLAKLPHSDRPECTCPIIAEFVRSWNDSLNDDDRNRLLKPLLPRLLNTRSTPEIAERRTYLALDWLVRHHTPAWLRLVPSLREHAERIAGLAEIVDLESARAAGGIVRPARDAARAAAWDAAWDAARDAAWDALRPTVEALQLSAVDLIDRMVA